jgi:predicted translation initiation factor SUI1
LKKLSSLSDLAALLPEGRPAEPQKIEKKKGYDGKPQQLKVMLETKGRGGKAVTIISGFQSNPRELDEICQAIKKTCGSGGTVRDNLIEIQGDHRSKIVSKLQNLGYIAREIR